MATPCKSQLATAPFETYRDPETGEWKLERKEASPISNSGNVIPFLRPTAPLPKVIGRAK